MSPARVGAVWPALLRTTGSGAGGARRAGRVTAAVPRLPERGRASPRPAGVPSAVPSAAPAPAPQPGCARPEHAPCAAGRRRGGSAHHSGPLPAPSRQLPVAKQLLFRWRLQRLLLIAEKPRSAAASPLSRSSLCALHFKSTVGCCARLPPPPPTDSPGISEVWTRIALLLSLPFGL